MIKGEKVFKEQFEYGKAYHYLIENGVEKYPFKNGKYEVFEIDMKEPIYISRSEAEPALKFRLQHPFMTSEVACKCVVDFPDYIVLLSMRIDGLEGYIIHEHKTTSGIVNMAKYEKSLQWRIYLFASGCREAQYNIFKYDEPKNGNRSVIYTPYNYFRYPTMESDLRNMCQLFISYLETKQLLNYAKRENHTAEYNCIGKAKTGSLIF